MAEVKTEPIKLQEGIPYTPGPDEVVITENHSISDIVRYAVKCSGQEDVQYTLDTLDED